MIAVLLVVLYFLFLISTMTRLARRDLKAIREKATP